MRQIIMGGGAFLGMVLTAYFFSQSAVASGPLPRAAEFVRRASREPHLRNQTVFFSIEGNHDAEAWLDFFFSSFSTASWVYDGTEEADYLPGPKIPRDVILLKADATSHPQDFVGTEMFDLLHQGQRYQLLISVDNERSVIEVRGYENWQEPVVYQKEFPFLPSAP